MIFNRGPKTLQQMVLGQLDIHTERNEPFTLQIIFKSQLKMNQRPNISAKTTKLLRGNTGVTVASDWAAVS